MFYPLANYWVYTLSADEYYNWEDTPMKLLRFLSTNRRRWLACLTFCLLFAAAIVQTLPVFAATLTVNSTLDRADANPGNGVCQTATAGECTLRAAIQEANALPGADTIQLAAGVYELGIPTINEDTDSTGDYDIRAPLTIIGLGAAWL